jgi:3-methylcrotonyl-CoA carboxylase alpha subunit
MFGKILIANRGEIACRIMATCARLNVRTVAVYSAADRDALHVRMADEAYSIGGAAAADSYLNIERIIAAARQSGAEAVHPGYGFLAENADFADACVKAGLVFIGPPASGIRAMGIKSAAKDIMANAGVPVLPGYAGTEQDLPRLQQEAERIGWPVLLKPVAGGGGKGMRKVTANDDFAAAVRGAKREAEAAFDDSRLMLEKCLERPRHIEIQVFADRHGNTLHLFERDCSVQRRHQKVIEEAPAPKIGRELRHSMGAAAVKAASAIGYVGAGTVEFLLDTIEPRSFYFMEMNTRLQVEHPVTEMITGQDLVEWQLKIAAGEPLPCRQSDLAIRGHAIEARIYAEDPGRGFLPSVGKLLRLKPPAAKAGLRIDSGFAEGDAVSPHYDPMIAKVIAFGPDRKAAIRTLKLALVDYHVAGVATNIAFLIRVLDHPDFRAGPVDTVFVERHPELLPDEMSRSRTILALAALGTLALRALEAKRRAALSAEPGSPWHGSDGWRLNHVEQETLRWRDGQGEIAVRVSKLEQGFRLTLGSETLSAQATLDEQGNLDAVLDGKPVHAGILQDGHRLAVMQAGATHWFERSDPIAELAYTAEGSGRVTAPMPGKIIQILTEAGADVARGKPLLVMEAMKMEHTITSPMQGRIEKINCAVGEQVSEGAVLVAFAEDKPPTGEAQQQSSE